MSTGAGVEWRSVIVGVFCLSLAAFTTIISWRFWRTPESLDPDGWLYQTVHVRTRASWRSRGTSAPLTMDEIRRWAKGALAMAVGLAAMGVVEIALGLFGVGP